MSSPLSSASPPPVTDRCPKCRHPLDLADKIWNIETTRFIRVYKCRSCGELVWED